MYVTRHSNVTDPNVLDEFWALYERAYEALEGKEVTREKLFRSEFDDVFADPSNRAWVVRDDNRPVAMSMIATDIGSTRYLSRAFFERTHPENLAAGRVHYVMWVAIDPDYQATRALFELGKGTLAEEQAEGAVLVFDLPETHQPHEHGRGAELFLRLGRMYGPAELEVYGASRYYAVNFNQPAELGDAADAPAAAVGEVGVDA